MDEYQDINHVQMSIVMQLCQEKQRVCAVGDDSQSIYSFRGANIDNILNYQRQFQGTRLFKLEQNYRSTATRFLRMCSARMKRLSSVLSTIRLVESVLLRC
ncbi:ATP-dependent DNA helicase pcrA [Segatella copri]|nr:ATP-dependent DNA helicase pcrA [Segatella copri]